MIFKTIATGLSGICIAISAYAVEIRVKSTEQLLREIGPDKTLVLEAGDYVLSQMAVMPGTNPYIEWRDSYDGKELWISGVNNLAIRGEGKVKILTHPRYSFVMSFSGCNNIVFENITAGHTQSGYCTGGVFLFEQCSDVMINNCILFGSGTVGIYLDGTKSFVMQGGMINNCTYGLGTINNSQNVSFLKTGFYSTGEFNLFNITASQQVTFSQCTFKNNFNGQYFPYFFYVIESQNISITRCTFTDNKVQQFTNKSGVFTISDCRFKKNTFSTPK